MSRYEQSADVHGEILIGSERIAFSGPGQRDHSWGERDWWKTAWCWTAGRLDDGTVFHGGKPEVEGVDYQPSYVGPEHHTGFTHTETLDAEGFPSDVAMRFGTIEMAVTPRHFAPILLVAPDGRQSRFPRALCDFHAADGRRGVGWTEWNQPPGP